MIELPKTTELNKRISKQKFYEKLPINAALRRIFIEQIQNIVWRNKLAPSTINLGPGKTILEIEFFEIKLRTSLLNEKALRQIDHAIPYPIVFLLEYEGKYKAVTAFKEFNGDNKFSVGAQYYQTNFLPENELPLKINGLDIETVYENFVRQIAGKTLFADDSEPLKDTILRNEQRRKLEKRKAALQNKIRQEKQLNKQVELNSELKEITRQLEEFGVRDEAIF